MALKLVERMGGVNPFSLTLFSVGRAPCEECGALLGDAGGGVN